MKVHFAIPAYGGQVNDLFCSSLLALTHVLRDRRVEFELSWAHDSHIGRGRNTLLSQYLLGSTAEVFQFLDTDLVFTPKTLADHLVAVATGEAPAGLTGGSYPLKRIHPEQLQSAVLGGIPAEEALQTFALRQTVRLGGVEASGPVGPDSLVETLYTPNFSWVKCLWLPTGLLTLRRDTAELLATKYEGRTYQTDGGEKRWDLFPTLPQVVGGAKILLSEDYAFCQLAREVGVDCWYNANLGAAHVGAYTYGVAT